RHRALVVADAFAEQQTVVLPGAVINLVRGIGMDHVLGARHRRVHVAVEDHAVATAGAVQRPEDVVAIAEQADFSSGEALALHPVEDVVRDLALITVRAVDVANLEGEPGYLVAVDQGDDFISNGHSDFPSLWTGPD